MFGWRWVRFKKSCWRLVVAFLATIMSAGFATGLLSNAVPEDEIGRVIAAAPISLVAWVWAFFVGRSFVESHDGFLFAISPLTPRRFFARNLKNFRVVHAYMFVVLPWFVWWVASFGTATSIDGRVVLCALLTYYVILLAPAAEHFGGPWSPTRLLFVPRHLLRFGFLPVIVAVAAVVAAFYFATEASTRAVRSGVEVLLDQGPPGLAIVAMISPASGVAALAEPNPPAEIIVGLCAVLAALLAWEGFAIGRAFIGSVSESEGRELEAWLEHRQSWLTYAEHAADEEQEKLDEWTEGRAVLTAATPETEDGQEPQRNASPELEDAGGLPYDAACTPEAQLLRHATYAQKAAGVSGMLAFVRHNAVRIGVISIIVLVNFGRFSGREGGTAAVLAGVGVFILFARGMIVTGLAAAWEPITRLGVALPVRVPRLVARVWKSRVAVDAVWDAAAAGAFVILARAPWWGGAALFALYQLVRLSGHVRLWLMLTRRKGARQDISVYQCLEILAGIGTVVTLGLMSTRSELRDVLRGVGLYAVLLGSFAAVIGYGTAVLLWRHRRADTSLPRNALVPWGSD